MSDTHAKSENESDEAQKANNLNPGTKTNPAQPVNPNQKTPQNPASTVKNPVKK
jgi:hypothetical protein